MTEKEKYCTERADYLHVQSGMTLSEAFAKAEREWEYKNKPQTIRRKPMVFFTSDLHFGHFNILRFDNRPFKSVQEMDETMISLWNETVLPIDTVYILGDVSWYDDATTAAILARLNGRKILVTGNHDQVGPLSAKEYAEIHKSYHEIRSGKGHKIVLSHYPIHFFNGQRRNAIMLYGHLHNSRMDEGLARKMTQMVKDELGIDFYMINVGCMLWDYIPRTLDELITRKDD